MYKGFRRKSYGTLMHGFVHGKNNTIIIRVIFLSDSIIVSIKDDCPHFNWLICRLSTEPYEVSWAVFLLCCADGHPP